MGSCARGASRAGRRRWRAARHPDGLLITTKVFNSVNGDPADHGLSRDRIRREVEGSLAHLPSEHVDGSSTVPAVEGDELAARRAARATG